MPLRLHFKPYWAFTTLLSATIGAGGCGGSAWGMYDDERAALLSLWTFPQTVAGDVIVTMLITALLTTVASSQLTKRDLAMGVCNRFIMIHSPPTSAPLRPLRTLERWLPSICVPGASPRRAVCWPLVDLCVAGLVLGAVTSMLVGIPAIAIGWAVSRDAWTRAGFAWYKAVVGALTSGAVHSIVCYTASISAGDGKHEGMTLPRIPDGETTSIA